MSPQRLIAEPGEIPGRPKLRGAVIKVTGEDNVTRVGEVVHEDPSGVILKSGASLAKPFAYELIRDPVT